ncbi:MAG: regulatory protein GemA, partial [Variovorax sp.]
MARDDRQVNLAKIHIAKTALNLSDEDYRAILARQGDAESARDLDDHGRPQVLAYFDELGGKRHHRALGQPEKIVWLWRKLGQAGALRDQSQAALLAFISRTTGVGVSHAHFLPSRRQQGHRGAEGDAQQDRQGAMKSWMALASELPPPRLQEFVRLIGLPA